MTKKLPPEVIVIRKAKKYLRKGWHQGFWACSKSGENVDYNNRRACAWCLSGALRKGGEKRLLPDNKLYNENWYKVFGGTPAVKFNDEVAESVEDVLLKLDHLEALFM